MSPRCKHGCATLVGAPGDSCGMCCPQAIAEREAGHALRAAAIAAEVAPDLPLDPADEPLPAAPARRRKRGNS